MTACLQLEAVKFAETEGFIRVSFSGNNGICFILMRTETGVVAF